MEAMSWRRSWIGGARGATQSLIQIDPFQNNSSGPNSKMVSCEKVPLETDLVLSDLRNVSNIDERGLLVQDVVHSAHGV